MKLDIDMRVHRPLISGKSYKTNLRSQTMQKMIRKDVIQQSIWPRFAYNRRIALNLTPTIHKTTQQLAGIFYERSVHNI